MSTGDIRLDNGENNDVSNGDIAKNDGDKD